MARHGSALVGNLVELGRSRARIGGTMLATLQAAIGKALSGQTEVNTVLFVLTAIVGQFLHGVLKWTRGEAESPVAWFTSNIKATVGAVIANIGITVAA